MKDKHNILMKYINYILLILYLCGIYIIFGVLGEFHSLIIPVIILLGFWPPYGIRIGYRRKYVSSDNLDISNPLYARGYFRKNAGKSFWLSDLKGFWYCQMLSLILIIGILCYRIINFWGDFRNENVEDVFIFSSILLFIILMILDSFYKRCYKKDIKYTENKEGIWLPFRFLGSQPNYSYWKESSEVYRRYYFQYGELKEHIKKEAAGKEYKFISEYVEDGKEMSFFIYEEGEYVRVLELIHVKMFQKNDLEYFNIIFIDFWKKYIKKIEMPIKSISFTFLLCIEKETKELKEFLNSCCVYPKKDRCILPAFLIKDYYEEYYSLNIGRNVINKKCRREYNQMQKELIELLGESISK